MTPFQIAAIVGVLLILGIVVFPLVNRRQFRRLPPDQQVRIIMKQAKGLAYFKNVSQGSHGVLYFVKNKRKILCLEWRLCDGKMLCTSDNPFAFWDYPEDKPELTPDELRLVSEEIDKYNKKSPVKIVFNKN